MHYLINTWNRTFYDALERRSSAAVQAAGWDFLVLAVCATAVVIAAMFCKLRLQISWRRHLTDRAIAAWLDHQAFYRLTVLRGTNFAPEHRIAEDMRLAMEPVVDLTVGFLSALATVVIFSSVLWSVGGSATLGGVTVPGHMLLIALAYAIVVTALMALFGRRFSQRIRDRSEAEARFRFELSRLRENAESIALMRGEAGEKASLAGHLGTVTQRWIGYVTDWTRMTWVTHGNALVAPVLPLLIMAPKYLDGSVSLGTVMQTATAFGVVQAALGWFTSNYARLSEWYAASSRVAELLAFIGETKDSGVTSSRIAMAIGTDETVRLENLSVQLHDGAYLITDIDLVIRPGEMVLINGDSGAGKSTLVRAIAGLWPWGGGQIILPASGHIAFLPQRGYIPHGTLHAAVCYPLPVSKIPERAIETALELTGLAHLIPLLDIEQPWDRYLSGGEQQRLGFARLLIHKPAIVILDEATSALDEGNEARMMDLFTHHLGATTVISVAHRSSLARYHSRVVTVRRRDDDSPATAHEEQATTNNRMRRAARAIRRSGMG